MFSVRHAHGRFHACKFVSLYERYSKSHTCLGFAETMVTLETSTSTSYISATTPLRSSQVDNKTTTCGKVGYYGDGCKYMCGACADNATCHGQTGDCPQHCACGWEGSKCNETRKGTCMKSPEKFIWIFSAASCHTKKLTMNFNG